MDHPTDSPGDFARLISEHQRYAYRLCYRMLGDHWDAEDASQEAFLRAYAALGELRCTGSLKLWLTRILVRVCLNWRRSAGRRRRTLGNPDSVAAEPQVPAVELSEVQRRVRAAVLVLPAKQRMALVLRVYEAWPFERIGEVMGTTAEAARMNASLARKRLRERLSPFLEDGTVQ